MVSKLSLNLSIAFLSYPYYEESLGKRWLHDWDKNDIFFKEDKIKNLIEEWIENAPFSNDEKSQVKKWFQDWMTGMKGKSNFTEWMNGKLIDAVGYDYKTRSKIQKWLGELFNTPYKE